MRESSTITSCGTGLDAIAAGDEAVEPSYRIDLPRESAAVERVLPVDTGKKTPGGVDTGTGTVPVHTGKKTPGTAAVLRNAFGMESV